MMSAIAANPYPLCPPFSRIPPNGSILNSPNSGTSTASMIGDPSRLAIHPGSILEPIRRVSANLFAATWVVATSNTKGGILFAGAPHAIGWVPNAGSAPCTGNIAPPPAETIAIPIMSCCIACKT